MRDGYTFFRSYIESIDIDEISDKDFRVIIKAMCDYCLNDIEPTLTGIPKAMFTLMRPSMDVSKKKADAGRKGGQAYTSKTQANNKQNVSNPQANNKQPASNKNKNIELEKELEKELEEELDKEQRIKTKNILLELVDDSDLSDPVKASVKEWLEYKRQRKDKLTEVGFKKKLSEIRNKENEIGATRVIQTINLSMSNDWRGIIWDAVPVKQKQPTKINEWMQA